MHKIGAHLLGKLTICIQGHCIVAMPAHNLTRWLETRQHGHEFKKEKLLDNFRFLAWNPCLVLID